MRTSQSLRLRLLALAALAIAFALLVSGLALSRLFAQHVEEREYCELANHQGQIVAGLTVGADGTLSLDAPPADPRFLKPNGGLYWQLELADGARLRSRSLWDTELKLPIDDLADGEAHRHAIAGPSRAQLLALERRMTIGPDAIPQVIRLTVAVDRHELDSAIAEFRRVLALSLGILGVALLAALLAQVQFGLRPLEMLRRALQHVHTGSARTIDGQFPSEVQPLVADLNALLDQQRQNNQRARDRAADLAHGFKTPLAILSTVARDLHRHGRASSAQEIDLQVEAMGRHVRRELARARTVGALAFGQDATKVEPIVRKVVAALGRVAKDRGLFGTCVVSDDARFAGDENDLLEIVGNLADNATKWAATKFAISAGMDGNTLELVVEDDGPGVPERDHEAMLMRGRRLDETSGGTGIGLSIVARIVDAYGATLDLSRSPLGGLRVAVRFTRATMPVDASALRP